jgi:hypothetical protein
LGEFSIYYHKIIKEANETNHDLHVADREKKEKLAAEAARKANIIKKKQA